MSLFFWDKFYYGFLCKMEAQRSVRVSNFVIDRHDISMDSFVSYTIHMANSNLFFVQILHAIIYIMGFITAPF